MQISTEISISNRRLIGFFVAVLCFKLIYGYFFYSEYQSQAFELRGICTLLNDSSGYYKPLESFVAGDGYGPAARMPGAGPVYVPLRMMFSMETSMSILVIVQIILDSVAVVAFGLFVWDSYRSGMAAWLTSATLTFSSFVAVWNNSFMMDSLGVSTLLLSVVFFHFGLRREVVSWKLLFGAGLFATWSVFLRQAHGLLFPIYGLFLLTAVISGQNKTAVIRATVAVGIAPALLIGMWTARNFQEHGRFVPLILPFHEGMASGFPKFKVDTFNVVKSLGGDIAPWSGESVWFVNAEYDGPFPFGERVFTTHYGRSEINALRSSILRAFELKDKGNRDQKLEQYIQTQWADYLKEYKHEHPADYWIWNRATLLKRFILQKRLDNLPFPPRLEMSRFQFTFKGLQLALLVLSTVFGTISATIILLRIRPLALCAVFPLAHLVVLACVLRYIEQRYLVPAHPFLVANCCFVAVWMANIVRRKRGNKPATGI